MGRGSNKGPNDAPARPRQEPAAALSELPPDELLHYGLELGLDLEDDTPPDEIVRRIRQRRELLIELDRDALLDVVVWARCPVRQSAGKEELAREIARVQVTKYQRLSQRGLVAMARLRGIAAWERDNAEELIALLRKQDGLWKWLNSKRRSLVGSLVARLVDGSRREGTGDYRFLPEETTNDRGPTHESLKTQIEEHGLVGGLATRLRGAADDYVRIKMDEIEVRIDAKLDAIDKRLAEWRDREVANRLKILRITLMFTVLVAVLSLGYNWLKVETTEQAPPRAEQTIDQP